METRHIPIELSENGFLGTVKQEGFPEEGLPDLVAHRPEPWRFLRLARVVGAANYIAREELGSDEAKAMISAMVSISDYEGDFGVIWKQSAHKPAFESIVNRALISEGEDEIHHVTDAD
ncbi:MAG: hypothetical protein WA940_08275 [Sphingopyxis sp.]